MTQYAYLKFKPTNREERKKLFNEGNKIFDTLSPIEEEFIDKLFNTEIDYPKLYREYGLKFKKACDLLQPTFFVMDRKYFAKMYAENDG